MNGVRRDENYQSSDQSNHVFRLWELDRTKEYVEHGQ
jgi:hypothetical protein